MVRLALPLVLGAVLAHAQFALRPGATGGPVRVAGHRLLNQAGTPLLLQGTEAPMDLTLDFAGTMFSTIRQRWNMNMVRLPISVSRAGRDAGYLPLVKEFVRRAHQAELYVVLAAVEEGAALPTARTAAFWSQWAAAFAQDPLVLFDLFHEPSAAAIPGHRAGVRTAGEWEVWRDGMQRLVNAVRQAGARQPVLAMVFDDELLFEGFDERWQLRDEAVIYEFCPRHQFHGTNAARHRAFGFVAKRVPLLAAGWDPALERDTGECRALPGDPAQATLFVRAHLAYLDEHEISWSASSFTPGRMIHSLVMMEPTELTRDIVCGGDPGAAYPYQGIGIDVQLHQWGMTKANLVTVSASAGAIEISQGGIAIGYGEVVSSNEFPPAGPLPTTLGGASIRVTDAAGVQRMAPLLYAGPGSINFLIDAETAPGMAIIELIHADGKPGLEACVLVAPVAPGFFTATMNARGPVIGVRLEGDTRHPLWECEGFACRTVPVPLPARVILYGAGFRQADRATLRATLGGRPVRIVEAGPQPEIGYNDQLVLELDASLKDLGEEDLVFWAGGRVSNVVRLRVE